MLVIVLINVLIKYSSNIGPENREKDLFVFLLSFTFNKHGENRQEKGRRTKDSRGAI